MKKTCHLKTSFVLLALLSFQSIADEPEDRSSIWEHYAIHAYSNLNSRLNGDLTPVFRTLGDFGELQQYFEKDQNPEKYEAYRQLLVQVLGDAMRGDVGEAMFANALIEITPPNILLDMIASEIGPGGNLEGVLEGKYNDVAKHIQRQPQQGHMGSANFIQYVRYLRGGKSMEFTHQVNREVIIDHMLRTDPQNAFIAMLWVDYNFRPYSTTPYGGPKQQIPEVQSLQMAYADISDYLYRTRYDMPKYPFLIPDGLEDRVRSHLLRLSQHDHSWVRLYVAQLLKSERMLRWTDVLEAVSQNPDPSIQEVMASIKEENPGFTRRPNKGITPTK